MTLREQQEQIEAQILSPFAAQSAQTAGRQRPEQPCPIRTDFSRDRDRILHCKSFRRLKRKTQVFLSPWGDHYRTRLTHTLEVAQIARTIARGLRLNEDLTEAIALGHDVGHTPFGHAGEVALRRLNPAGFLHYDQSVRVLQVIEREFAGLNLTQEVTDGIANHTKGQWAKTLEGQVVRFADQIAFLNHDIEDAEAGGVLQESVIPAHLLEVLGRGKSRRITTLILAILNENKDFAHLTRTQDGLLVAKDLAHPQAAEGQLIRMQPEVHKAFLELKAFMYESVYINPVAKREEKKVGGVINGLFDYYMGHLEKLPNGFQKIAQEEGAHQAVTDYIAGMTDDYATDRYCRLYVPQGWGYNEDDPPGVRF